MTHSQSHAIDPTVIGKSKVSAWLMALIYPLGQKILHWYFGEITITGQAHLSDTGPIILAPTHRSRWDGILLSFAAGRRVTGRDLRFMVTASEVRGVQGWLIRHLGGFPIDTTRPELSSLFYSVALLRGGEMLVIFPEGGIFHDRQVHPLKRGVGRIAMEVYKQDPETTMQVIPVTIQYSDPFPKRGTNVDIAFGPGIAANQFDPTKVKSSSEQLTQRLKGSLQSLYLENAGSSPPPQGATVVEC
ncbi:MAG: 1-acyl-sn-glycerol-3-phosphate acyltransferase [Synechocystis sp.]|nr:1-acyl-sn-glycerol-3-phosphate acyltransferase [Synechocystis sp.]